MRSVAIPNLKLTPFLSIDGINASYSVPPSSGNPTPEATDGEGNEEHHVKFIPLSPQSSRTLLRHREESAKPSSRNKDEQEPEDGDLNREDAQLIPCHSSRIDQSPPRVRRRRNTDPSSNRPLISHRQQRARASGEDSDEEDTIEYLPDRFDSQGRPLDGSARGHSLPRMHSRRGDFEYHSPKGPGGLHMRGHWGVMGTDSEAVERIVENVTGVLEGKQSWLGLVGGLLSGSLLKGIESGGRERGRIDDRRGAVSDDEEYHRRRDRKGKERDDKYRRRGGDEVGESSKQGAKRRSRRRIDDDNDEYLDDGHDHDYGHGGSHGPNSDDSDDDGWRKRRRDVRRARTWDVPEREVERDRRHRDRDRERNNTWRRRDWDDDD